MPKTRHTKKQKLRTTTRRHTPKSESQTFDYDNILDSTTTSISNPKSKINKPLPDILVVPGHYIVSDLKKTLTLSAFFIGITVGIYFFQDQLFNMIQPLL